jgi:nitrogen fixation protein NifU and related proteins
VSDLEQLYQRAILTHHEAPRHAGRLDAPTHSADGNNPLCGDRITVSLRLEDGRVHEVRQEVRGCAICRAAGSLMAEAIAGQPVALVQSTVERFLRALAEPSPPPDPALKEAERAARQAEWGPLAPLLEARRFPGRRRCASLSWETLQRALASDAP